MSIQPPTVQTLESPNVLSTKEPWIHLGQANVSHRTALICVSAFLSGIGLLSIYASSSIPAAQNIGNDLAFVQKQAAVAFLGFLLVFAIGHLPFRWIERLAIPSLLLSLVLMILVFVPGFEGRAKGASRWILLFGFTIQPAEFCKLAVILFLARNLSRPKSNPELFLHGVLPNLVVSGLFSVLLMLQPDFGSTSLILFLTVTMLYVAGLPYRFLTMFFGLGVVVFIAALLTAPYRLARLLVFLDPWSDARAGGFQIIQSYLGFQNGGVWGVGLGESKQKLFFLPEAHTDFILSVIGEEFGLFGVLLICACFAYMVFLGLRITLAQDDTYRQFLAFGLTMLIGVQAALNMGVTMGLLPTKGMTLPLVSNGSNSLIVFLIAIAILARISQESADIPSKAIAKLE